MALSSAGAIFASGPERALFLQDQRTQVIVFICTTLFRFVRATHTSSCHRRTEHAAYLGHATFLFF
jgi:hypothetical protein